MIDELDIDNEADGGIDLASEDFFEPEGRKPILPGAYLSRSRTLESAKTRSGAPSVKVKFEKFQTPKGEDVRDFPPFETLYFHKQKSWDGEGEISTAGRYLRACGKRIAGLSNDELKASLNETENTPVMVIVAWEQDYKEFAAQLAQDGISEDEAKERKIKPKKTSFFKNADGTYTHQKMVDGRVYTARSRVSRYEPFKG